MKELKGFALKDFLWFEKMITPQLVTYLYWLGILGSLLFGLIIILTDFSFGSLVSGILFFIFGVICSRVFYELVIILFKIYDKLEIIAEIKTKQVAGSSTKAAVKTKTTRKAKTAPKKV